MADYLEPGLVAEAYVHFVQIDYSPRTDERLYTFIREHAEAIARARFGSGSTVSVEIEPGSLKTKAKVIVATIGTVFVTYGSFRQSVDYAVRDSRWFSDHVIPAVVETVHNIQGSVYRMERRTGIPGRIQEIAREIEGFAHKPPRNRSEAGVRIENLRRRTEHVFRLTTDPESREIIANTLQTVAAAVPKQSHRPRLPSPSQPALPPIVSELEEYLESLRRRKEIGG